MEVSATYSFQTFDNPADTISPTFNNLLGINNAGLIDGFYGSGNKGDPNQGFLLKPPSTFTPVDFPGQAQTQLTGLNDKGIEVGYFYPTNNGIPVDNQFGFYVKNGAFTTVNNPKTPTHPNPGVLIETSCWGSTTTISRSDSITTRPVIATATPTTSRAASFHAQPPTPTARKVTSAAPAKM